jgi:hypothetical protein
MSGELVRASDSDREHAVAALREHLAAGRLSLEEFTERMSAALAATTTTDLEAPLRELPFAQASRRSPTRFVLAAFGSVRRDGRLRVKHRVFCFMGFGNIDLDLRQATLEGDTITVVALGAFGAIDVYVPEGVEVDVHGFALFGHKRARGKDIRPLPGTPLVRSWAFALCAGIDVWRVPAALAESSFRDAIRGTRELER